MELLGLKLERLRKNSQGFWQVHQALIVLFIISLVTDGASTVYFMLRTGPQAELHPAIYVVSIMLGPIAGPVVSVIVKAIAGICLGVYCRRFAVYIFLAAIIISFLAAWYNVTQVLRFLKASV